VRSSATDEDEEEACSAIGIADILIENVEADSEGGGMDAVVFDAETLKGHLISENFGIAKAML
jgi:hypothetical protein